MNVYFRLGAVACLATAVHAQSPVEHTLPILNVRSASPGVLRVPDLSGAPQVNLGDTLTHLPGVCGVRRSHQAAEPVIRGMGWERVVTQVNGLPLHGACPARMDPPVVYISSSAPALVHIDRGLSSVTDGPGGSGGRIRVNSDPGARPATGFQGELSSTWNGAQDGVHSSLQLRGGDANLTFELGLDGSTQDDYESAKGLRVPAGGDSVGANAGLSWRSSEAWRFWLSWLGRDERDVPYPALPMDLRESRAHVLTTGAVFTPEHPIVDRVQIQAGHAMVDHDMDNRDKPNRRMLQADTHSETRSSHLKVQADLLPSDRSELKLGVEGAAVEKDALRNRFLPMTGARFRDPLWPGLESETLGAFAEWGQALNPQLRLLAGLRVDAQNNQATAATPQILTAYRTWNNADDTDQDETLVSGQLGLIWSPSEHRTLGLQVGRVSRAPNLTEQFFVFAPAPGGFQVGNPGLDPEVKDQIEVSFASETDTLRLALSAFYAEVSDYIQETTLGQRDVNQDGIMDRIRGFRNVDARFYGGEAELTWTPAAGWSIPLTVASVRADNRDTGVPLPEIPPLTFGAALRYTVPTQFWVELGATHATEQTRIDPEFGEDATASHTVAHLRAGWQIGEQITLTAGVENLFDKEYTEHLTRNALMAVGDLAAGDEVPAPGRYATISLSVTF